MKLQQGRETEKKTATVQMPRTVGVVKACQLPFAQLNYWNVRAPIFCGLICSNLLKKIAATFINLQQHL